MAFEFAKNLHFAKCFILHTARVCTNKPVLYFTGLEANNIHTR